MEPHFLALVLFVRKPKAVMIVERYSASIHYESLEFDKLHIASTSQILWVIKASTHLKFETYRSDFKLISLLIFKRLKLWLS